MPAMFRARWAVVAWFAFYRRCQAWIVPHSSNYLKRHSTSPTLLTMELSSSASTFKRMPKLDLPEPIYSNVPGTWAFDTMSRRIDQEILQRTEDDNREFLERPKWAPIYQRFQALRAELQNAATTPLTMLDPLPENATPEGVKEWEEWHEILRPFLSKGDTWLTAPWMVTEFYVYRRLIQAFGFWDVTSPGYKHDPFVEQKRAGLVSSVGSAEAMLGKVANLPPTDEGINLAASIALWGNKMDLSLWPAEVSNANKDVFSDILVAASENLLHDDSSLLAAHCQKLRSRGGGCVDIIVDNAGFELVTDLALAQHLIQSGIASIVTLQLKSHPTFVSDALESDVLETVQHYQGLSALDYPNGQNAGELWRQFLDKGKWVCRENNFWVQGFPMWDMTEPLKTDLATRCDLAFVKGDANYRRLLGDRLWDLTAPFQDVVGAYFPCPVCALRTLKAELGCGMDKNQIEKAKSMDPYWMVNGRFGVVHFGQAID